MTLVTRLKMMWLQEINIMNMETGLNMMRPHKRNIGTMAIGLNMRRPKKRIIKHINRVKKKLQNLKVCTMERV